MRIVHVCVSDSKGGAGKACRRLHDALLEQGIDSIIFAAHKHDKDNPNTISPSTFIEKAYRKLTTNIEKIFTKRINNNTLSPYSLSLIHI